MFVAAALILGCSGGSGGGSDDSNDGAPARSLDLADIATGDPGLLRLHGSSGNGSFGVPVAGGADLDGDGDNDLALAAMRASPLGRGNAGEVFVLFGDGTVSGAIDTGIPDARILRIQGAAAFENAGSEVWMDDVTGDGIADLIVSRQNHTPAPSRVGAGAVSILVGGAALAAQAATLAPIDLAAPPAGVTITTFVGVASSDRLGMWARTGDVTGDGIADLAMSADQLNGSGTPDCGAVYLVRGGAALAAGGIIDLEDFGTTALPGDIARILPPPGSIEFHLGATLQVADLDGNGRAELIAAATLILGNFVALSQTNIKRLLAYSSIAHAGYIMMAVAAAGTPGVGDMAARGALIYILAYTFTNIGAFAVALAIEKNDGTGTDLKDFIGLSRSRPILALMMAVFMLSLTGIPLTGGFIGKWVVFQATLDAGLVPLAVIGVLTSVVSAFYYIRVVVNMYLADGEGDPAAGATPRQRFLPAP